ncbi:MAG TPA: AAA family ATPase, partial [Limnochordia bacterium]|nr:AAA family ATPase [Limnochordia bacterium]
RLAFSRLEVRRMPGFSRGGFALDNLSPGLNVVFGPNGAGKTTTARALQALLWPDGSPRAEVWGRFRFAGGDWVVEAAGAVQRWQRDGGPAASPVALSAEARHRYRLALADLLQKHDGDLAAAIVRETVGGYDVARAVAELGFDGRPEGVQKARTRLRSAQRDLDQARGAQRALLEQEQALRELAASRDEAAAAGERAERLERVLELGELRQAERAAHAALAAFPEWMPRLKGNEAARLDELARDAAAAREAAAAAQRALSAEEAESQGAALPDGGFPEHQLDGLRVEVDLIASGERELQDHEQAVAAAKAARAREQRSIGPEIDPERLAELDLAGLDAVGEHVRRAEMLRERRQALEGELAVLTEQLDAVASDESVDGRSADPERDRERLRDGIRQLTHWLRVSNPSALAATSRTMRLAALAAAALAFAAGLILTFWLHPAFALIAIAAVVPTFYARPIVMSDERATVQTEFRVLGLRPPGAWTPEGVLARLEELQQAWAGAEASQVLLQRSRKLRSDLRALETDETGLAAERERLAARFGVPPETRPATLLALFERVGAWQEADRELAKAEAERARAAEHLSERLRRVAAVLAPLGYGELTHAAGCKGALVELERRVNRYRAAQENQARSQADRARAEQDETRAQTARRELFQGLGLDPEAAGCEAAVRTACERLEAYVQARDAWRLAADQAERAARALHEHGYAETDRVEHDAAAVRSELDEARQLAGGLSKIQDEITALRTRIELAKSAHDVEAALAECAAAEAELQGLCEEEGALRIGRWLAEVVRRESYESDRPEVFRRAAELFALITKGAYRLELSQAQQAAFLAVETATGEGRTLDELSSGTRVQLLIAVRIAFVEAQESGARLPLLLDETLANSDDERAQAITEAVIALSQRGRQVFVFTAQSDEVARWQNAVAAGDVAHQLIDLGEVRRLEAARLRPLAATQPAPRRLPPAPDGSDYAQYGRRLAVPGID